MTARRAYVRALSLLAIVAVLTACAGANASPSPSTVAVPQTLDEVREIFERVDFDVESADADTEPPDPLKTKGMTINTMADFLTYVLNETDRFWSNGFKGAGLTEPQVTYAWPTAGETRATACGEATNEQTAAYCSRDDTIYISQQMAYNLWEHGCSGNVCDENVAGDFSVAYIVGHEMAHNIEHELGLYQLGLPTWRMELLADCMSGMWTNRAYFEGLLDADDVEEGVATANLIGDYDFTAPDHHGTPAERVQAFHLGWDTGDLSKCVVYLDTTPIP